MFSDMFWFCVVVLTSIVLTNIIFSLDIPSRIRKMLMVIFFLGVVVHEISHAIASLLVGLKVDGVSIRWKSEENHQASPHGSVRVDPRRSFLQQVVVSFAPLLVSTWLFFYLLDVALNDTLPDLLTLLAGLACFSLLLGAAPSHQDIVLVGTYFKKDVKYSLYQITLLSFSVAIVWLVCFFYEVAFLEFVYYLIVGAVYYVFKYLLEAILLIARIKRRKWRNRHAFKNSNRTTHRPLKPRQLHVKEAHW